MASRIKQLKLEMAGLGRIMVIILDKKNIFETTVLKAGVFVSLY